MIEIIKFKVLLIKMLYISDTCKYFFKHDRP